MNDATRIRMTIPNKILQKLEAAADLEGMSVPNFILQASLSEADYILKARTRG